MTLNIEKNFDMKDIFNNSVWIGADMSVNERYAPIFKKEIVIKEHVKNASVSICGLGLFELRINGILPDDTLLNPAHTQYSSSVLYRTFDITKFIACGINTVTVELGNGFFNENSGVWNWQKASWRSAPKFIAEIEINYFDGSSEKIATDTTWLITKDGPTVENSIYQGEVFDSRRTEDTFVWKNAVSVNPPSGKLKKQEMPPIRRIAYMVPEKISSVGSSYIIVSPEMTTGWISLRLNVPEAACVTITYGEQLTDGGYVQKIGKHEGRDGDWWPDCYLQQDIFIGNGKTVVFEPKFSYKGFKYVQIDNYCGELCEDNITIYRIANDVPMRSEFKCSDELINKLHYLMVRTLRNNFQGKPTDTPVWEKNGWLGDASCALETMMYNFDMSSYLESFINTMADCFFEYGDVPVMVPTADWSTANSPVWNTVFVFGVKALCDYCGNIEYAKKIYPVLKVFAEKDIEEIRQKDWVWHSSELADWVSPMGNENSMINPGSSEGAEICATAYIYKMLRCMEQLARLTSNDDDISNYSSAADCIYHAFNNKFFNEEKGIYETSVWTQKGERNREYRQTSNLLPLAFGMVPEDNRKTVTDNLIKNIISRNYRLDTGCIGTKYILPVLIDSGYTYIAEKILTNTSYPSWGYWIKNGSDTAWECWENTTRSKNHYFLGTYDEALFSHIAGVRDVKNGFKTFTVKPNLDSTIKNLEVAIDSPCGKIISSWKTDEKGKKTVYIKVPKDCVAKIIIECKGKRFVETDFSGEFEYVAD